MQLQTVDFTPVMPPGKLDKILVNVPTKARLKFESVQHNVTQQKHISLSPFRCLAPRIFPAEEIIDNPQTAG